MSLGTTAEHYARYFALGWSSIPIERGGKISHISWKLAQGRRQSDDPETVHEWLRRWPRSGIAVITGSVSGVFVIDVDSAEALTSKFILSLPATAMVQTTKGRHYYFRIPPGETVPTKVKFLPGIDVRGEGGYAVVPPSIHASSAAYTWLSEPEAGIATLDPLGAHLGQIRAHHGVLETWTGTGRDVKWRAHVDGVAEGGRNDAAASIIGKLLADSPMEFWEPMVWRYVADTWNLSNDPPLPTSELRTTFDSIARKENTKRSESPDLFGAAGITHAEPRLQALIDVQLERRDPVCVIRGLLNEGLTILIGKPKKGKSTLAQQIALDVASGSELFYQNDLEALLRRRYPVVQGEVLHLALEDHAQDYRRRAEGLLETREMPTGITLATDWPPMMAGGLAKLEEYIKAKPDVRLIIIDTFARFMGGRESKLTNAFTKDYEDFRPLHDLAGRYHTPILVLTHARKDSALKSGKGDPLDDIAGTGGGIAAADALIVLKRYDFEGAFGELAVTGRFIPSYRQAFKQIGWRFTVASPHELAIYFEKPKKAGAHNGPLLTSVS